MTYSIAGIVGSLSSHSINRALFGGLVRLGAEADLALAEAPIKDLPLFSQDLEANFPQSATVLKEAIENADGIIIVTPEYNRSIPGVLKNALDWASRPWGKNSFAGKPVAVIGTSVGTMRTALAQRHLRDILAFLDARIMNQPEAYVHMDKGLIADDGSIAEPGSREFLSQWLNAFHDVIAKS